jgi:hypothetical protein
MFGIRDPRPGIRDPEKIHPGSRILGIKKHRIPDPQHWVLHTVSCRFQRTLCDVYRHGTVTSQSYPITQVFKLSIKDSPGTCGTDPESTSQSTTNSPPDAKQVLT